MDVFIATENINKFKGLLGVEKDESHRRVLLELLDLEKEKLAAAVQARITPAKNDPSCP
jgi:hypothetical protein